jgi:hypothetical protein
MEALTPGIYYQDILQDGTRSVLRKEFPQLKRVSYDKRPPVVQTLIITVENLVEKPLELTKEVDVLPEIIAAQANGDKLFCDDTTKMIAKLFNEGTK